MNRNFKDLKSTTHLSTSDFISFKHSTSVITVVVFKKNSSPHVLVIAVIRILLAGCDYHIEPDIAIAGGADVAVCFCHHQLRRLK